jgi:hypothetical protein
MAFFILPAFKHLVQTLILFVSPSIIARTILRLGKKRRLLIPVIRWPTPPFFLANPRLDIVRPATGFFPHISHIRDIVYSYSRFAAIPACGFAVAKRVERDPAKA